jgi:NAD(P)-dependent dehydrogenase (short-subunit alcohol dehydrogenase family)
MKRVASEIASAQPKINVVINNAGAMFGSREVTEDGLERTFALNQMAYFVLTHGLLERLVDSAPSRIINTASGAHSSATLDFNDLQSIAAYRGNLFEWLRYGGPGFESVCQIEAVQHTLHARTRAAARGYRRDG